MGLRGRLFSKVLVGFAMSSVMGDVEVDWRGRVQDGQEGDRMGRGLGLRLKERQARSAGRKRVGEVNSRDGEV